MADACARTPFVRGVELSDSRARPSAPSSLALLSLSDSTMLCSALFCSSPICPGLRQFAPTTLELTDYPIPAALPTKESSQKSTGSETTWNKRATR